MNLLIEKFDYLNSAKLFSLVAQQPWSIFLDSGVLNGQAPVSKHADYDVLAIKPIKTLVTQDGLTVVADHETSQKRTGDPLDILKGELFELNFPQSSQTSQTTPAYLPGALGYVSYDLARQYEEMNELAINDEQLPEMAMGIYGCIVLIDHQHQKTLLISINDSKRDSLKRGALQTEVTDEWRQLIKGELDLSDLNSQRYAKKLSSEEMLENMSRVDYQQCFDKVKQYIVDGDCYQVNLAKQFSTEVTGDCWLTYDYLRELSPAPYGAYMNFPFAQVLSNSPESFIQCRERKVVTSPIKGTRPRFHDNKVRDKEVADELFNSPKDRAENLMIVDLMRNDLSTSCEFGSVKVPKLFSLHSFANVHHLISTIVGRLKHDLHSLDLLRRCFPGGSITGAPKIRAMQIIEELEPHRRGLYCGAITYVGIDGNMETNIAIRTIVVKDGIARYSAGGGLVIDSDSDEEYQEVIDKSRMMTEALFE